jgi:hypothetical protein
MFFLIFSSGIESNKKPAYRRVGFNFARFFSDKPETETDYSWSKASRLSRHACVIAFVELRSDAMLQISLYRLKKTGIKLTFLSCSAKHAAGCRVEGYLDVARVPGTLVIRPHGDQHNVFDLDLVNVDHRIDHLSFGTVGKKGQGSEPLKFGGEPSVCILGRFVLFFCWGDRLCSELRPLNVTRPTPHVRTYAVFGFLMFFSSFFG